MNEIKLSGTKGIDLHLYEYLVEEPKAIFQIFHGMGEHAKRYEHFAKYLNKNGFSVYMHDHRKMGKSVDNEENVGIFDENDKWEFVIDDCDLVNHYIRKNNEDLKIIVFGHSMGSIIARRYLQKYGDRADYGIIMGTLPPIGKVQGFLMVSLAKVLNLFNKTNKRSGFLGKTLNKPLNKEFEPSETHFDWLTTDQKQIDKYVADPLCGYNYSTKFYLEFFKAIVKVNIKENILETHDYPILFIAGKDDPVGDKGAGVKKVYDIHRNLGFSQVELLLMDGMRHEILNETSKKKTYDAILKWLSPKL